MHPERSRKRRSSMNVPLVPHHPKPAFRPLWLAAVLATISNCSLDTSGLGGGGSGGARRGRPMTGVVFCDIEDQQAPRHCATADEATTGIRLSQAAVALVRGQSSSVGLDFSPAALQGLGCAADQGVAITFKGPFPEGTHFCLEIGRASCRERRAV